MIYKTDDCVGCPPDWGCLGSSCPNRNVIHLECDHCHKEVNRLYWIGQEQWCAECVLDDCEEVVPEAELE